MHFARCQWVALPDRRPARGVTEQSVGSGANGEKGPGGKQKFAGEARRLAPAAIFAKCRKLKPDRHMM
jgi:hypothetical protein